MLQSSNRRRAFSLVELIMAMAVSSILIGTMGVVLITASSALEQGESPIDDDRVGGEAIAEMQADLAVATRFFETGKTAVWFEVPDRNNDGVAEHIRYAWTGGIGSPLTRSTNGGAVGIVAANVQALDLTYVVRTGLKQAVSAERAIASFTAHAGASSATGTITAANRVAEVFRPSLAADVATWKATRVRLSLRQSGSVDATVRVSLVAVKSDNTPGTTVYASADVKEATMSAALRLDDVTFTTCLAIPAGQAVAIVLEGINGVSPPCDVGHLVSVTPTMPFNSWRATSADSGSSWTGYGQTQNVLFEMYGTVTTQSR